MYQHAEHYFRIMNVDDGESQQHRSQNRGNGSDPRQQPRNAQQPQDGAPAGIDTGFRTEQPAASEHAEGVNGPGDKDGPSRGNGAAAQERENGENPRKAEEDGSERPPRRSRRNASRSRAPATDAVPSDPAEPSAAIETEAAADAGTAEADSKDVH
jgi:hypothetical protein